MATRIDLGNVIGPQGDKGDTFTFNDLSNEEIAELKSEISTYIKRENYTVSLSANNSVITIPDNEYKKHLDLLEIYINGVHLHEGKDYTKTDDGVKLNVAVETDCVVEITLTRSVSATTEDMKSIISPVVNSAIAEVIANAPEDFDTLKEISDWIDTHEDSASAMNTAILENKTNIEKKKGHQSVSTSSNEYRILKFAMNSNSKNQVISITDQYGGCIEIYGAAYDGNDSTYKKIKAIRKSYGYHADTSIVNNTDYKIRNVKFDKSTNTIYVELKAWAVVGVDGAINPISLTNSIPETAISVPLEFGIAQFDKNCNDIVNTYATKTELANWNCAATNYTGNPNDCAIGKWYSINTISNSTNMPNINGWANVITFAVNNNSSYKQQLCYYNGGNVIYTRTQINGTWGKWERLAKTTEVEDLRSILGSLTTGVMPLHSTYTQFTNERPPAEIFGGTWTCFSDGDESIKIWKRTN